MSFVNVPARQLVCKLAAHGVEAARWIASLARLGGAPVQACGPLVAAELAGSSPEDQVRGLQPRFHAFALAPGAPCNDATLHELLSGADGVLLLIGGTAASHASDVAALEALRARVRRPTPCIVGRAAAILFPGFAEPWTTAIGEPVTADPGTDEGARALLAAIGRRVVATHRL